ncbi:c-type cytochrome [Paraflavitalea sp. CAU 1676]|uniref:c-type cytochrome n=1 Tax=Paraflavitalea sp. CAU 1676 TaxID=3032598 RepID=UPI0023DC421F|nr:c-type cytochrome [Paraflavitalea sp. CAU 1676]MDF2189434.1 c-type cytochrome [Paraflavitalea sp. CAU 1676]
MKVFLKILKWTGIIIVVLVVGLIITVACRQNLQFEAPYPDIKASTDSSIIARGRYIAYGPGHCTDCHHDPASKELMLKGQEVPLSGGMPFKLPIATIYVRNITPDMETGIGKRTDAEIARLLRYGVRPDNTAVLDFMPFHDATDEDLTAIISFLRSQKPVKHEVPQHEIFTMGKVVKAFMIKPVGPSMPIRKSIPRDTTANYGKYIANSIANCVGCHSNRDPMTGAMIGEPFAGGMTIESIIDAEKYSLLTPNLTPDATTGRLAGWSQEQFIQRFRQGRINPHSPMPWPSYSRMSDDELKALFKYLQSLKPVKNEVKSGVITNQH